MTPTLPNRAAAGAPFTRSLRLAASALATSLLLAACGGGTPERSVPLPLDDSHATVYTEAWLAQHPEALVQPGHIVVLHQEASADDSGGSDDTGNAPGVDEIAYHVPNAMTVTLKVDADSPTLSHLVLRDDSGRELGRHHRDMPAPTTVTLQPGRHFLEVHHRAKGDRSVAPATIFLRLGEAGQVTAHVRDTRDTRAQALHVKNAAAGVAAAAAEPTLMLATASISCTSCQFANSTWNPGSNYDGADFTGSTFTNMMMDKVSFVGVTCYLCTFIDSSMAMANFESAQLYGSAFRNSQLNQITIAPGVNGPASCERCLFSGTSLNGLNVWGANLRFARFEFAADVDYIDMSGADCTGCQLYSTLSVATRSGSLLGPVLIGAGHFQGTTLQGAYLTNVSFTTANFNGTLLDDAQLHTVACTTCNFPGASLQRTLLINVVAKKGNWVGADLTGVQFSGTAQLASSGGSSFAQAKMMNMQPSDVFKLLTACCSDGLVDYTGTQFDGMDLSGADFSAGRAILSTATDFSRATLSNGSVGINLAGQRLSTIVGFAGKDLRSATMTDMDLRNTNFMGSDLSGAHLSGSKMSGANLKDAKLIGAQIGIDTSASIAAADLTDTWIAGADFTDANLRKVDMSRARGMGNPNPAKFTNARLDDAQLANAILPQADFGSASMSNTNLTGAKLTSAMFTGANLAAAKLGGAVLWGADFSGAASVDYLILDDAQVSLADGNTYYTEQDGSLKTVAYTATKLGVIGTTARTVSCPNRSPGPCNSDSSLKPGDGSPWPPISTCITDSHGVTTCKTVASVKPANSRQL